MTTEPAAAEPAAAEPAAAEAVFAALADPTRRLILDRLSRRGDASATVLADELPVTRQAVVKHLAVLDQAGLVTARRDGRERRYRVRPAGLEATARWMDGIAAQWAARLSTIKRLAERAERPERDPA
ncbi:metalloregulator ArsR/SmtB family transcription factor [Amycolatopsis sp. NPDC051128]|uniref:ArsR/SmtB family transcription factor n=1 Tax=Amycolatopsis sp. NPDC051128 TaxID=3155412 RepID=UPI003422C77E